jgi:hypothetical protein
MLTLLFKGLAHDLEAQHNNILVKNLGVSSYIPGVVLVVLCFGLDENVNERFSNPTRTLRVPAGTPDLLPCRGIILAEGEKKDVNTTKRRI